MRNKVNHSVWRLLVCSCRCCSAVALFGLFIKIEQKRIVTILTHSPSCYMIYYSSIKIFNGADIREHTLPGILLNCTNLSVTQNVINLTKPSTLSVTYCAWKKTLQIAVYKKQHDKKKKLNIAHMSNIQQTKQLWLGCITLTHIILS